MDPSAPHDLLDSTAYANPTLDCDIVMKGGITSGVVYPWAICRIARRYRLRSIGGTSAGAIAAAAAAAAELGRHASGGGFARLAELPRWLGQPARAARGTNLRNLFQPSAETAPLMRLLAGAFGEPGAPGPVRAALRGFPRVAALGALPGLVIAAVAVAAIVAGGHGVAGAAAGLGLLAGLALAAIGALGLVARATVRRAGAALPANLFGLCTGFAPEDGTGPVPLTTWLADELDRLAGRDDPARPVTFGDLDARGIRLRMLTTSLTHGAPYALPFETRIFFFDPDEFRRLFPRRIVDWMVAHARRPGPQDDPATIERCLPRLPLPEPADLPVVVAARMSLSFPGLLSAVPLWAVDRTAPGHPVGRVWFSDGGIASNFPVHLFDAPLPRWPTFAINLGPFRPGEDPHADPAKDVWMPDAEHKGIQPRWTRIEGVGGFTRAVLDTMQNWADNAQIRVPGFRDRVVLVKHTEQEGGLNLDMPSGRIDVLAARGAAAGDRLVRRFSEPPSGRRALSWDSHRWARYRTAMALLESWLDRTAEGYAAPPQAGARTYAALVARALDEPPNHYAWARHAQRDYATAATNDLLELVERLRQVPQTFAEGAPGPTPLLRITPAL